MANLIHEGFEDFKAVIVEFLGSEIPRTTDRETRLPLDTNYVIALTGGGEDAKVLVVSRKMEPKELIPVTYAEDKVEEREVKALRRAEREINAKRSIIITWNYHGRVNGYQAVPLWYWLLRREIAVCVLMG